MKIAVITGSGLEGLSLFKGFADKVLVIERHGPDHRYMPTHVRYVDNIRHCQNFKADLIIAVTACGSLKEELVPGTIVLPWQFIDRTYLRENTSFSNMCFKHMPMARPFAEKYFDEIRSLVRANLPGVALAINKTIVTIEGPRFSTMAESIMNRALGADIVNMTTSTECTIANEFGIPYLALAMVTDYDAWKMEDEVSMDKINAVMKANTDNIITVLHEFIKKNCI